MLVILSVIGSGSMTEGVRVVESVDLGDLWAVWRHGWKCGRLSLERGQATIYLPRPDECPTHGGPCVGRGDCEPGEDVRN